MNSAANEWWWLLGSLFAAAGLSFMFVAAVSGNSVWISIGLVCLVAAATDLRRRTSRCNRALKSKDGNM